MRPVYSWILLRPRIVSQTASVTVQYFTESPKGSTRHHINIHRKTYQPIMEEI
jgi:hypothetical protein